MAGAYAARPTSAGGGAGFFIIWGPDGGDVLVVDSWFMVGRCRGVGGDDAVFPRRGHKDRQV